MKTRIRVAIGLSVVLLLAASSICSAYSSTSSESQRKEKTKKSGWIGIMVKDVNERIAKKEKLDSEEGAFVDEVVEDSPADSAGIKEGDVIVEFNGKKLFDADDLVKAVQKTVPGTKLNLVVIRDGEKKILQITVGKRREMKHRMFGNVPSLPDVRVFIGNHILGLQLITLNEQLGEYFGAPNNEGVLVEEVEKESAGEKAGFKAGDVLMRVGKKTVDKIEKVCKEFEKYDEEDKVEVEVLRKGTKKVLSVDIDEEQSIHQNFFFRKPNMRMFLDYPFDELEMHLEMDELRPDIENMQIEVEQAMRDLKVNHKKVHGQV